MRLWLHIKNTHEPLFFKSLTKKLDFSSIEITSNAKEEVISLLKKYDFEYNIIEKVNDFSFNNKILNHLLNTIRGSISAPNFDIALSHGSPLPTHVSLIKSKTSVSITDNDLPTLINKSYLPFVSYLIVPSNVRISNFTNFGIENSQIIKYNGFKEDIYIADYVPDPNFLDNIPFQNYVVVRPEALEASYVHNKQTIVPELVKNLLKKDYNILYLPRNKKDYDYVDCNCSNIFIPPLPLNGLDICYHSQAVMTGSGTFAREAALLNVPSFSFFPEDLLSVDQKLVNEERIYHSRQPKELVDNIPNTRNSKIDTSASSMVRDEIANIINEIFTKT